MQVPEKEQEEELQANYNEAKWVVKHGRPIIGEAQYVIRFVGWQTAHEGLWKQVEAKGQQKQRYDELDSKGFP